MAGAYEKIEAGDAHHEGPSTYQGKDWAGTIEQDLERELARRAPVQIQQEPAETSPVDKPLHMAVSAIPDDLDRRTREWRGSAKVVEQSLRQLAAAEQAHAAALRELADAEADVARIGQRLTEALASFDDSDGTKDIDPLFAQSQAALDDLDRVVSELSIAQHWCRAAWKYYSEALDHERQMRLRVQSAAA